ncbi:hypothetical protein BHE74_00007448 [Ensete ventricosum]|nr:hypothetical protein BHE74_00007448 [Ensete ventricosum]
MPWEVGAHRGGAERFGSVLQLGVGPLTRWTLRRKLGSVVRGRRDAQLAAPECPSRHDDSYRGCHAKSLVSCPVAAIVIGLFSWMYPLSMTSAGRQAAKLPHVNWGLRSQLMS